MEEGLGVVAHRAYLGSLLADDDVAAVGALPHHIAFAREDEAVLDVLQELQVAGFVSLFNLAHQFKQSGNLCEAFLAGGLGHTGVHVGPFKVLACGGILQVGLRVRHVTIVEQLEPNLGVFHFIAGSLLKEVGDLIVAFCASL